MHNPHKGLVQYVLQGQTKMLYHIEALETLLCEIELKILSKILKKIMKFIFFLKQNGTNLIILFENIIRYFL